MARDKLSNFVVQIFSQLFPFFAHEVCTNHEREDFLLCASAKKKEARV